MHPTDTFYCAQQQLYLHDRETYGDTTDSGQFCVRMATNFVAISCLLNTIALISHASNSNNKENISCEKYVKKIRIFLNVTCTLFIKVVRCVL